MVSCDTDIPQRSTKSWWQPLNILLVLKLLIYVTLKLYELVFFLLYLVFFYYSRHLFVKKFPYDFGILYISKSQDNKEQQYGIEE